MFYGHVLTLKALLRDFIVYNRCEPCFYDKIYVNISYEEWYWF